MQEKLPSYALKKASVIIGIVAILAVLLGLLLFALRGSEDEWICQNGKWIKHGNPGNPKPTSGCEKEEVLNGKEKNADSENGQTHFNMIRIDEPKDGAEVSSPLEIIGEARGTWFFEGDFPIEIIDEKGKSIAIAPAGALGEWMKEDFVPFRAVLDFSKTSGSGKIIIREDNPAGETEEDLRRVEIPVKFTAPKNQIVRVYFSNSYYNSGTNSCSGVYEVKRIIPKTQAPARAALEELLSGPTKLEEKGKFSTNINSGVEIQNLKIENGIAKVDFSDQLQKAVGGSCRVTAIRAQITETLKQFSSVKEVIISINGKTEEIF